MSITRSEFLVSESECYRRGMPPQLAVDLLVALLDVHKALYRLNRDSYNWLALSGWLLVDIQAGVREEQYVLLEQMRVRLEENLYQVDQVEQLP